MVSVSRATLLVLAAALLLAGCSLSQKKVEQVDARVTASREGGLVCPPERTDRCALPSPLLEAGREAAGAGVHRVVLSERGEEALQLRLHLIRAARDYIDLQNFILRKDESGMLLLDELLQAARRGVQVRLLLDQMFSFSDAEYLVALTMAHRNFEIRFYNPSFYKAEMAKHDWVSAVACCFRRFNQRMHNKLMVVDDVVGIVGGRNIADRYFDYDTKYNFKDLDVLVYGPVAEEMRDSFDGFWTYYKTIPVQHLRDVAAELLSGPPPRLEPHPTPPRFLRQLVLASDNDYMADRFVDPALEVQRLEFFSDRPRKQEFPEDAPTTDLTRALYEVLLSAQRSVVIQSPYMVLSRRARELFRELRERNPDIELVFSTNSLASTDADTVYGHTHRHKRHYIDDLGFEMYEFKPFPLDAPSFFPRWPQLIDEKKRGVRSYAVVSGDDSTIPMPAPRVGLHSKAFVVDGRVAMIGSHNFDPRSEGFNTENGIVIWDERVARELERQIRKDIEPGNSWVVALRPRGELEEIAIEAPAGSNTEFLPWLDGSTSVYELQPGGQVATPGTPEFYRNYYPVGSFPQVVKTRRQITVVILGSLFGFLEPIL